MNLDELLADSAPPVTPPSSELTALLDDLVRRSEAEAAAPLSSRRRRAIAAGVLTAGVLSAGGMAAAAGVLPSSFPWTTTSGTSCRLEATAELRPLVGGGLTRPVSAAERNATLASAQDFLATIDLDSIDRRVAEDHWIDYVVRSAAHPVTRAEVESEYRGDRLEVSALLLEVDTLLNQHLVAEGHDPKILMTGVASGCDE